MRNMNLRNQIFLQINKQNVSPPWLIVWEINVLNLLKIVFEKYKQRTNYLRLIDGNLISWGR